MTITLLLATCTVRYCFHCTVRLRLSGALRLLQENEIDVLAQTTIITADRQQLLNFSYPLAYSTIALVSAFCPFFECTTECIFTVTGSTRVRSRWFTSHTRHRRLWLEVVGDAFCHCHSADHVCLYCTASVAPVFSWDVRFFLRLLQKCITVPQRKSSALFGVTFV